MGNTPKKPEGFEDCLSEYKVMYTDSICGEPVAWGFNITKRIGDERFSELRNHGELKCDYGGSGSWSLIVNSLSREEAIKKYGEITNEEFGVKGGWKSVTFGKKKFISDYLRPQKPMRNPAQPIQKKVPIIENTPIKDNLIHIIDSEGEKYTDLFFTIDFEPIKFSISKKLAIKFFEKDHHNEYATMGIIFWQEAMDYCCDFLGKEKRNVFSTNRTNDIMKNEIEERICEYVGKGTGYAIQYFMNTKTKYAVNFLTTKRVKESNPEFSKHYESLAFYLELQKCLFPENTTIEMIEKVLDDKKQLRETERKRKQLIYERRELAKKYFEEKYPYIKVGNILCSKRYNDLRFSIVSSTHAEEKYNSTDTEITDKNFNYWTFHKDITLNGISKKDQQFFPHIDVFEFVCTEKEFESYARKYDIKPKLNRTNIFDVFAEIKKGNSVKQ